MKMFSAVRKTRRRPARGDTVRRAASAVALTVFLFPAFAQGSTKPSQVNASASSAQTASVVSPSLQPLASLDQLRQVFNADAGKIRVVLLLSPT